MAETKPEGFKDWTQGYLFIPIRDSMNALFSSIEEGEADAQKLLEDEKEQLIPMALSAGWQVFEIADRFGWSHAETRHVISKFFRDRASAIYTELDPENIAVEVRVFAEMIKNGALRKGKESVAWRIYKEHIIVLQDLGFLPRASQKFTFEAEETWEAQVSGDGVQRVVKKDKDDNALDVEFEGLDGN